MAIEVALLLLLGVVIVVALITLAKPLTEAFAEKIKFNYKEMGSESEKKLKDRLNILEGEVLTLKQRLTEVQETVDFLSKEIESPLQKGSTIKVNQPEVQE